MKPRRLFLALPLLAAHGLAAEPAIPANFPAERYEALIARSPFTLATPAAAPAPPPDKGFADGWYVTSLARVDGQDFVSIKSRDGGVQLTLFGTEPKDGVALQKVDWSSSIGRSTVTISKDGQVAKLEFNQAEIAAPPAAPPQPGGVRPGGTPGNAVRPSVPRPVQPIVQPQGYGAPPGLPNAQPVIPRPGGAVGNPAQPAGNDRRRIRVIQNGTAGQ